MRAGKIETNVAYVSRSVDRKIRISGLAIFMCAFRLLRLNYDSHTLHLHTKLREESQMPPTPSSLFREKTKVVGTVCVSVSRVLSSCTSFTAGSFKLHPSPDFILPPRMVTAIKCFYYRSNVNVR